MKPLVVISFRGRPDLLDRCLDSAANQDDPNYSLVVIDDASNDPLVDKVLEEWEPVLPDGSKIIQQHVHKGTLRSQVEGIRAMEQDPASPVLWLDGDDRFAHGSVVSFLRGVFEDRMVDVSYGSYRSEPYSPTCPPVKPILKDICANGSYRQWARRRTFWNHARVMRRRIFDAIPDDYFKRNGLWLQAGGDHSVMTAALERAGGRHVMQTEELIVYTSDRAEAEWRTRAAEVQENCEWVYSMPPLRPLPPMEPT